MLYTASVKEMDRQWRGLLLTHQQRMLTKVMTAWQSWAEKQAKTGRKGTYTERKSSLFNRKSSSSSQAHEQSPPFLLDFASILPPFPSAFTPFCSIVLKQLDFHSALSNRLLVFTVLGALLTSQRSWMMACRFAQLRLYAFCRARMRERQKIFGQQLQIGLGGHATLTNVPDLPFPEPIAPAGVDKKQMEAVGMCFR